MFREHEHPKYNTQAHSGSYSLAILVGHSQKNELSFLQKHSSESDNKGEY